MAKPVGTKDRLVQLREAIFQVMEEHEGGIAGYLKFVAKSDQRSFTQLVGKLLPTKIANEDGEEFKIKMIERIIKSPDKGK